MVQSVSGLLIEQYETAATNLAETATADLPRLLECDPAARGEDPCVRAFLGSFGQRAYRRPLGPAEIDRLFRFYLTSKSAHDFRSGVRMTVQAMLQSPAFLYHWEAAPGKPVMEGGLVKLDAHQVASRLSYFLWGSMPDDALFAAADGPVHIHHGEQLLRLRVVDAERRRDVGRRELTPALGRHVRRGGEPGRVEGRLDLLAALRRALRGPREERREGAGERQEDDGRRDAQPENEPEDRE